MTWRGVRGATVASENSSAAILAATRELLETLVAANGVEPEQVASAIFTMTPDLDAAFPARAARELGWKEAALLDTAAPRVRDDLRYCIRVLILWNTEKRADQITHVYLREARSLRPDWSGPVEKTGSEKADSEKG